MAGMLNDTHASSSVDLAAEKGARPLNKRPAYGCQVTVLSQQEKALQKLIRKEERREERRAKHDGADEDISLFLSREEMRMQR